MAVYIIIKALFQLAHPANTLHITNVCIPNVTRYCVTWYNRMSTQSNDTQIVLKINGKPHQTRVDPATKLAEYLRDDVGVKVGDVLE